MDKRNRIEVKGKTINQERRKAMKRFKLLLIMLPILIISGLTQGCSDKASPTEPTATTSTDTGTTTGTGPTNPGSTSGDTPAPTTPMVPDIDVSPTSLDFGVVKVGQISSPLEFTIKNVGTAVLSLSLTYSGDLSTLSATDCGYELQPGEQCVRKTKFMATTSGAKSGSLQITSNDPDEPTVVVHLSGTGFVLIVPHY